MFNIPMHTFAFQQNIGHRYAVKMLSIKDDYKSADAKGNGHSIKAKAILKTTYHRITSIYIQIYIKHKVHYIHINNPTIISFKSM